MSLFSAGDADVEWVNVHVNTARSPEYLSASNLERAVWFSLLSYCAAMENGGRIAGAKGWADAVWMMSAGVKAKDVLQCRTLVQVVGEDVSVMFYPLSQEKVLHAKREGGRKGNLKRWASESHTDSHGSSHTDSVSESVKEGKGKEGNGKESPPNPQGGLSEGELRFVELFNSLAVLTVPENGAMKFPAGMSPRALAVAWHNCGLDNVDPRNTALIGHLTADATLRAGTIRDVAAWLKAEVAEFQGQKKQAARAVSDQGPGA